MHRSGTSLCSNILHEMGVDMAEAHGAAPANARGHWERPRINDLHDEILALFGRAWSAPTHHLALQPDWWADPRVEPVRARIVDYLAGVMRPGQPFGFKDPRASRLLAMWPSIFDRLHLEPVYVFCVRDPAQVARSITARDRLAGDQAAYRWLVYNAQAVAGVADARVCVIRYEQWFTAPEEQLARLATFVGLPARAELLSIIDDDLRHDALGDAANVPGIAATLHRQVASSGAHFDRRLLETADAILGCEQAVLPFLIDAALLPMSVAEQNRVISDLQNLVERLRGDVRALKAVLPE